MTDCIRAVAMHVECLLGAGVNTTYDWLYLLFLICLGTYWVATGGPLLVVVLTILLMANLSLPVSMVLAKREVIKTPLLTVRPPKWADRAEIADIWFRRQSYLIHGLDREAILTKRLALKSPLLFRMMRYSTLVGVAHDTGAIVGVVIIGGAEGNDEADKPATSIGIDVHPKYRRQGFGRELVATSVRLLQKKNCSVWVGTSKFNHAMRAVMDDLGFAVTKRGSHVLVNGRQVSSVWYHCKTDPQEAHTH